MSTTVSAAEDQALARAVVAWAQRAGVEPTAEELAAANAPLAKSA